MNCHTNSHIVDSTFFRHGYSTEESRQIFCDLHRMQRWLSVEAALARSQADLDLIPAGVADEIEEKAKLSLLDISFIQQEIKRTSHSLVPLLKAWQQVLSDTAGQFIHYGATTQDIQDTAQSLELKDVCGILERDLVQIIDLMAALSMKYKDLVVVGRTHGQHALPTTLGLKIAGWLDETLRNFTRLKQCKKELLVAQLFGGVGTMDALSDQALPLLDKFAKALGLAAPTLCWHNARDRIAEYLSILAMLTGGFARAANEIYQLAKNEIQELNEPFQLGQIGSSTMPHKKNPELCEQIVVLSRLVKAQAGLGFDGIINEHERDYRAVRLEWVSIAEASMASCSAASLFKSILAGLVVDEGGIAKNLQCAAESICTETLMFAIGKKLGKQRAHEHIYQASVKASARQASLCAELAAIPEVKQHFDRNELETLIKPVAHTGQAMQLVENCLQAAKEATAQTDPMASTYTCPLQGTMNCG